MCKCGRECKCQKSARTTGLVFNPWPEKQVYVFYCRGNVFAEMGSVKPNEKSLIVTNRCRVA